MTLSRANFIRLAWLNILCMVLAIPVVVYELLDPRWIKFSSEFDTLSARTFGTSFDTNSIATMVVTGIVLLVAVIMLVASAFGILWFQRWARLGLWLGMLIFLPLMAVPGFYPTYTNVWWDLLALIGGPITGAILLMAYSPEHGGVWFAERHDSEQEI